MSFDSRLITQLDRPIALTGVNPRSIMGQKEWNRVRLRTYKKFDYHCQCCGTHKLNGVIHPWIECHEQYKCDYATGKCELLDFQALCYPCHHFIHRKRLKRLYELGHVPENEYLTVIEHGIRICRENNLKLQVEPPNQASWDKWRLIYKDKQYSPLFQNKKEMLAYTEWLASIKKTGNDELLKQFREVWNNKSPV